MSRRLITDTDCELMREVFSRAARLTQTLSSPSSRAASYSGATPGSATGGTRHTQTAPEDPELAPRLLGVVSGDVIVWVIIAALIAACLVLGGL